MKKREKNSMPHQISPTVATVTASMVSEGISELCRGNQSKVFPSWTAMRYRACFLAKNISSFCSEKLLSPNQIIPQANRSGRISVTPQTGLTSRRNPAVIRKAESFCSVVRFARVIVIFPFEGYFRFLNFSASLTFLSST